MNWYKETMFSDPKEWGILFQKLLQKLGRNPTMREMYEAELEDYFSRTEEKKEGILPEDL